MLPEAPYEIERPLLELMLLGPVCVARAAQILEVTEPSAQTLLHHLESIGIAWQLPLEPRCRRSPRSADWEITPHGRRMVDGELGPRRLTSVPVEPATDTISATMARHWRAA
jgi:hypothetical protein